MVSDGDPTIWLFPCLTSLNYLNYQDLAELHLYKDKIYNECLAENIHAPSLPKYRIDGQLT